MRKTSSKIRKYKLYEEQFDIIANCYKSIFGENSKQAIYLYLLKYPFVVFNFKISGDRPVSYIKLATNPIEKNKFGPYGFWVEFPYENGEFYP